MSNEQDEQTSSAPTTVSRLARSAAVDRRTAETHIRLALQLDDGAQKRREIETPSGFFSHMLDALAKHSGMSLQVHAEGDVHIDLHHTVEDTGIALGQALAEALGERRGIARFGHAYAPLDEALARAVIDLSGRGFLVLDLAPALRDVWVTHDFPLTLVEDFFQALADRARLTLHLSVVSGRNPHHVAESLFKAFALALRQAIELRSGREVPSTKGTLTA